ncbi:MAG: efflux RND transporter permease subunit [Bacteroidetes bacterium]|nr:efflux RND transporter permease subunit [Bacteroidota bacterium]
MSGLALGIGMLIDNSIVVVDNITRKRKSGLNISESIVEGTNEVIVPVISQVLTTVAVYLPLILLNGMASILLFDQSIALTISLAVSLLVAFVLAPILYKYLFKDSPENLKEDTILYKLISRSYHKMITHILKFKPFYLGVTILIMPIGIFLGNTLPINSLPAIEKRETLLHIDWNEPVDAVENLKRVKELQEVIRKEVEVTEAEVGIKQFILPQEYNSIQKAEVYYKNKSQNEKYNTDKFVYSWLKNNFSKCSIRIIDAPNAFTQLFETTTPFLEARFKRNNEQIQDLADSGLSKILYDLKNTNYTNGIGLEKEKSVELIIDFDKMNFYGINLTSLTLTLQKLFGIYTITEFKRFGENKQIQLRSDKQYLEDKISSAIVSANGQKYQLSNFIKLRYALGPKYITADKTGVYQSIYYNKNVDKIDALQHQIKQLATSNGYTVEFKGKYFENKSQMSQLALIFLFVLILLYIILALQYESLIEPIIVMLTIPLGITGAVFLLWLTNSNLDIMAAIGFIVILGLVVDDPILKIETLNRLEKKYKAEGLVFNDDLLERMIHEAGDICLKPLLMVSLTTSIALVPVIFIGGLGNDLQKPMAYVIIGGLTIGTFFTTWFIPLSYWYIKKLVK